MLEQGALLVLYKVVCLFAEIFATPEEPWKRWFSRCSCSWCNILSGNWRNWGNIVCIFQHVQLCQQESLYIVNYLECEPWSHSIVWQLCLWNNLQECLEPLWELQIVQSERICEMYKYLPPSICSVIKARNLRSADTWSALSYTFRRKTTKYCNALLYHQRKEPVWNSELKFRAHHWCVCKK